MEVGTILSLIAGIVGLLLWWAKRKRSPTPDERRQDVRQQYHDSLENVHHLRSLGNHAEADAMLRRLAASAGVRGGAIKLTIGIDNPYGQCLGHDASEGKQGKRDRSGDKEETGSGGGQ